MIGFFDSGVGGLTVLEEVHRRLPRYDTLYLGDAANAPYGTKTHAELVTLAWRGTRWLFDQGCALVIIACNSASARALREIQQTKLDAYPAKRVLGIIRPTVEALSRRGHRRIAVLSTVATRDSGAYAAEFAKYDPDILVLAHACPNWVTFVEEGKTETPEAVQDVEREIRVLQQQGSFDAVLLACTHYPYLKHHVERTLANAIPVFNQDELVAASLEDYLHRHPELETQLEKNALYQYVTTGDAALASRVASERFGFDVRFKETGLD